MIYGVLLLLLTGLCWAFSGALMSDCARNRVALALLLGPQQVLVLLAVFLAVPDYRRLAEGVSAGMWALMGVMLAAGRVNGAGLLAMQRAMRQGHHGMTWAIGQSAMVIPFLAGVLLFREPPTLGRVLGVGAILSSLAVFGLAREHAEDARSPQAPRSWFPTALGALVLLGIGQALTSLPSHLPVLADRVGLRIPLIYLGKGLFS